MNQLTTCFAVTLAAIGVYALCHIFLSQLLGTQPRNQLPLNLRLYALFLPLMCGTTYFGYDDIDRIGWTVKAHANAYLLFTLFLFSFCYLLTLFFYSALDHSVRIRLCVEFFEAGPKGLSYDDVIKRYGVDAANQRRFLKLYDGEYLSKNGDKYVLTDKGRRVGRLGSFGKHLFKVDFAAKQKSEAKS